MNNQRPHISSGQLAKRIASLALPMSFSQFISICSGFLCMSMLAQLGHDVLAASALIMSTQMSIMMIGMSILFSLSILVGHAYGASEYRNIGSYMQQAWTLALIMSVPLIFIFWHIATILTWLHQDPVLIPIIQSFFHTYVFAVIPVMLTVCNQQFGYGVQKQRVVITGTCISAGLLLLVSYVFIFGKWGMPKLGVAGLACGMVVQPTFFLLFTTTIFATTDFFKKFDLFHYRVHQNLQYLRQMFKIGWPICLQIGGEMLSFFFSANMVGWISINALAAYQVVNQYLFLIIVPIFSLSQASGILIGQACGAKRFHEVKRLGALSVGFSCIFNICFAILFLTMPDQLAKFYMHSDSVNNHEVMHLITILFMIVSFSVFFDGIKNVLTGALRGTFDTRYPMYVGLGCIWLVGIPLGYILAFNFHFGIIGIAFGSLTGMLIACIFVGLRWQRKVFQ